MIIIIIILITRGAVFADSARFDRCAQLWLHALGLRFVVVVVFLVVVVDDDFVVVVIVFLVVVVVDDFRVVFEVHDGGS